MMHRNLFRSICQGLALLGAVLWATSSCALGCIGDCDGDGEVTVGEIILGVNIALDLQSVGVCQSLDGNESHAVEIDELVTAINVALNGCPPATATATASSMPSETATAYPTPTRTLDPTRTATIAPTPSPAQACVPVPGMLVDCFKTSGLAAGPYDRQSGAAVADVDGDSYPDVFVWMPAGSQGAARTLSAGLFRNLGHGMQFTLVRDAPFVPLQVARVVAAAFGDLDNDGKPDLVVAASTYNTTFRLYVYQNLGDARFAEVTDAWGFGQTIEEPEWESWGVGVSLVDLNLDGRLDLVEYRRNPFERPLTFLSEPDGTTWKEAGKDVFGDARGLTWTFVFTDWNHDQLLDVFVLNDNFEGAPNRYYTRVDQSLTYQERDLPFFGRDSGGAPMGGVTADLDGDGEMELVFTDTGDQHVLSLNTNVEGAWGVRQNPSRYGMQQNCWSVTVIDLENDGRPDLFFACAGFRQYGTPEKAVSYALRNTAPGSFEIASGVLADEDVPTLEVGLAAADFDQDGRLDLLTGGDGGRPRLLWNQIEGGRALAIRLKGKRVNAQGIGARVQVDAPGLPTQVREMYPGGTTWSYSDSQLLFGMGAATNAQVTVDWRPAGGTAVQTTELTPGAWVIEEP